MKHLFFALAAMGIIAGIAQSQQPPEALPPAEAMSHMLGRWQGEGWRVAPGGDRQTFRITETLTPQAGGQAVAITGIGETGPLDDPVIVHHAYAMIWREPDGSYRMRSVVSQGYTQEMAVEISQTGYIWTLEAGPAVIRYESAVEDGVWIETGTQTLPSGETRQIHEMRLERAD